MLLTLTPQLDVKESSVEVVGSELKWVFKEKPLAADGTFRFTLTIRGTSKEVKKGKRRWLATIGGADDETGDVFGLVARYDPSLIRPVLSAGANYLRDDHIDFKITEIGMDATKQEFLDTVNDSRLRANATLGVLFKLKTFKKGPVKSIDFLTGLDFTDDTQKLWTVSPLGLALASPSIWNSWLDTRCGAGKN